MKTENNISNSEHKTEIACRDLTLSIGDNSAVAPWAHNPSSWSQRIPVCILAAVGAGISMYLAMFQLGIIDSIWDPIFGEGTRMVLTSDVSNTMERWWRIPDASLGAWAYLGDAIFGLAGSTKRWFTRPWLVIIFGIDVIPLGIVSAILVFMQGAVVGYWCFLCLVTAVISLVLICLAYDEVWSSLLFLWRVWKKTRSKKRVWQSLWGTPHAEAVEIVRDMQSKPQ